jgi:hypothetical protein
MRTQLKTRIVEDSKSSARRALSECIVAHEKNPELLNVLRRRYSTRRVEKVCKQAQEDRELFELWKLEERSTEGTFTGLLNTQKYSRRSLSKRIARRASISFSI